MHPRARIGFLGSAAFLTALTLVALLRVVGAEPTRTHAVVMEDMKFTPAELRIAAGDRVVFQNKDLVPHTATAQDKAFDSGPVEPGASWTLQPGSEARTINYACLYHPMMKGTIIVVKR